MAGCVDGVADRLLVWYVARRPQRTERHFGVGSCGRRTDEHPRSHFPDNGCVRARKPRHPWPRRPDPASSRLSRVRIRTKPPCRLCLPCLRLTNPLRFLTPPRRSRIRHSGAMSEGCGFRSATTQYFTAPTWATPISPAHTSVKAVTPLKNEERRYCSDFPTEAFDDQKKGAVATESDQYSADDHDRKLLRNRNMTFFSMLHGSFLRLSGMWERRRRSIDLASATRYLRCDSNFGSHGSWRVAFERRAHAGAPPMRSSVDADTTFRSSSVSGTAGACRWFVDRTGSTRIEAAAPGCRAPSPERFRGYDVDLVAKRNPYKKRVGPEGPARGPQLPIVLESTGMLPVRHPPVIILQLRVMTHHRFCSRQCLQELYLLSQATPLDASQDISMRRNPPVIDPGMSRLVNDYGSQSWRIRFEHFVARQQNCMGPRHVT